MGGSGILGAFEELVLLSVTRQAGEGYGVSIRRELAETTGRDVSMGAVHATLERLEEKGLVASGPAARPRVRPGRPRRCFRVTADGARELAHTREVRDRLWDGVTPALAADDGPETAS
ncbi:MAG: helix-turn-helix transcriptional regulator [Longimicrobiales bacterium]